MIDDTTDGTAAAAAEADDYDNDALLHTTAVANSNCFLIYCCLCSCAFNAMVLIMLMLKQLLLMLLLCGLCFAYFLGAPGVDIISFIYYPCGTFMASSILAWLMRQMVLEMFD